MLRFNGITSWTVTMKVCQQVLLGCASRRTDLGVQALHAGLEGSDEVLLPFTEPPLRLPVFLLCADGT